MTSKDTIYLVSACCGVMGAAAWFGLILVPAWSAYTRIWQRLAAGVLSLYVLAAMMGIGLMLGGGVIWVWDHYLA